MSILGSLIDVGVGLLSSSSNKKALNRVAGYATEARDANNVLAQSQYDRATQGLSPYIQQGQGAANALYTQAMGGPDWQAYLQANPDVLANAQRELEAGTVSSLEESAQRHYAQYGQAEGRQLSITQPTSGPTVAPVPTYERPTVAPLDLSVQAYQQSPGYAFQQERGMEAIKADKSIGGLLNSGAAVKSALEFSQGLADQDYNAWADRTTANYYKDIGRTDTNFAADRTYGTSLWADQRHYDTSRFDTRNALLGGFADQGFSATQSGINAGQNFYAATAGNNDAYAGIMSDVSLGKAANRNALYAQIPKAYAGIESSIQSAMMPSGGGTSSYMTSAANNFLRRF